MWGKLIPAGLLGSKVMVYRTTVALVAPAPPPRGVQLTAPLTLAYAASDPYLSRVTELGTARVNSLAELAALVERLRAGALLLACHPSESGELAADPEELGRRWADVRRALEVAAPPWSLRWG